MTGKNYDYCLNKTQCWPFVVNSPPVTFNNTDILSPQQKEQRAGKCIRIECAAHFTLYFAVSEIHIESKMTTARKMNFRAFRQSQ